MNSYDFKDRVAIITGGGQGIGLCVAERMLLSGGRVSIWDRDEKLLKEMSSRADPDQLQVLRVDIGDLKSVEAATIAVFEKFQQIDILADPDDPRDLFGMFQRAAA